MADNSFDIAKKELKIAQTAEVKQLFQLLNFKICIYGEAVVFIYKMPLAIYVYRRKKKEMLLVATVNFSLAGRGGGYSPM